MNMLVLLSVLASLLVAKNARGDLLESPFWAQAIAKSKTYHLKHSPARNDFNEPFVLNHEAPTRHSILLIHGLGDSPYFMRDLAEVFYGMGWNVVGILLSGNGSDPDNLKKVTAAQWEQDLIDGFRLASKLGNEVFIGGFSTGGTLAIDAATNSRLGLAPQVKGLFLFSPALDLHPPNEGRWGFAKACAEKIYKTWNDPYPATVKEDSPIRYRKTSINGVCQVEKIMDDVGYGNTINEIHFPVFIAVSEADYTVSAVATKKFASSLGTAKEVIVYPETEHIMHTAVPLRSDIPLFRANPSCSKDPQAQCTNPHFDELKTRLEKFIKIHFE